MQVKQKRVVQAMKRHFLLIRVQTCVLTQKSQDQVIQLQIQSVATISAMLMLLENYRSRNRINNVNADTVDSAVTINAQNADVLFRVENTGVLELYRVKAYHDPVSPVNSGWEELCLIGVLKPGQVRYCKRPRTFSNSGSNLAVGRVQGANAIISPTDIINASNPTYFNAP